MILSSARCTRMSRQTTTLDLASAYRRFPTSAPTPPSSPHATPTRSASCSPSATNSPPPSLARMVLPPTSRRRNPMAPDDDDFIDDDDLTCVHCKGTFRCIRDCRTWVERSETETETGEGK